VVLQCCLKWAGVSAVLAAVLSGCSTNIELSHSNLNGTFAPPPLIVEVDDEITAEELKNGLKKAKFLLTGNPFLTAAENNISSLEDYSAALDVFMGSPAAGISVLNFFARLLKLPLSDTEVPRVGPGATPPLLYDRLEPASLPAYLYLQDRDFREFVTADYCVGRPEQNYPIRICKNAGQIVSGQNNQRYEEDLPQQLRAGFITTQSFLKTAAGALNFRRAHRVQEIALCNSLPGGHDTGGWSELSYNAQYPDPNLTTHPFYWSRLQPEGSMDCNGCHSGSANLNSWRVMFTGFDDLGAARMGQSVSGAVIAGLTINNVEAGLVSDPAAYAAFSQFGFTGPAQGADVNTAVPFEPNISKVLGETIPNFNRGNPNRTYPMIRSITQKIANHPAFATCMATHFFQFAMKGEPQAATYVPPEHLMEEIVDQFRDSNFKAKTLLKAILLSPTYLNQAE
jgi:hypothetical protein